ncbi:peptidyl-alpha-hydroxyglycine alpha-amidating lyase 2-like [Limulus polyphemus]|uniref:peptidylamidoglycolate lyase n=1 Tax=Limulus polyphemus TaxID=6850 RepID=A0ABM1BF08_LIMPO|nr:peptidyl-alpha-hydroxyglycine alpha-amidating lyase 2-like [Limulus polyphemus]
MSIFKSHKLYFLLILISSPTIFRTVRSHPVYYERNLNQYTDFYEQLQELLAIHKNRVASHENEVNDYPVEVIGWPKNQTFPKGQTAGVDVDSAGRVHVFHRGDVVWDAKSFDWNNVYQHQDQPPISVDSVIIFDSKTGDIQNSWGKNRFYMPHGLTIDKNNNTWLTDVALHQVFKFKPGASEPDLVLGQRFVPGNDESHFCKPTDVAVASSGKFYVSDGYCNSRILMFSPSGQLLKEFGKKDDMLVPHSLTLLENLDILCVADRENERILCYSAGLQGSSPGLLVKNFHKNLGRVFAVAARDDHLYMVQGPGIIGKHPVHGLTLSLSTKKILNSWSPVEGFVNPHDLALSPDGTSLYVVEIGENAAKKVYKFSLQKPN